MERMKLQIEHNIRKEFENELIKAAAAVEKGSTIVQIDGSDVLITTEPENTSDRIGGTFKDKNGQIFYYYLI